MFKQFKSNRCMYTFRLFGKKTFYNENLLVLYSKFWIRYDSFPFFVLIACPHTTPSFLSLPRHCIELQRCVSKFANVAQNESVRAHTHTLSPTPAQTHLH